MRNRGNKQAQNQHVERILASQQYAPWKNSQRQSAMRLNGEQKNVKFDIVSKKDTDRDGRMHDDDIEELIDGRKHAREPQEYATDHDV